MKALYAGTPAGNAVTELLACATVSTICAYNYFDSLDDIWGWLTRVSQLAVRPTEDANGERDEAEPYDLSVVAEHCGIPLREIVKLAFNANQELLALRPEGN